MIRGVIFDFNGTMLLDNEVQEESWIAYLSELLQRKISNEEYRTHIYGKINKEVFEHFLMRELTKDEIAHFSDGKEITYLNLLKEKQIPLSAGLPEFLNYLKANHVRMGVATSAPWLVVSMLYDYYSLDRWMPMECFIYDDGTRRGKPEPDLYLEALDRLQLKAEECICFEDSDNGILSADRAGMQKVIVMDPYGQKGRSYSVGGKEHMVFRDFQQFTEAGVCVVNSDYDIILKVMQNE